MNERAASHREPLLLHLCCAPCSPHPVRKLKEEYDVTLYFYNPNIHPEDEYLFRLGEVEKLALGERLPLVTGVYDPDRWHDMTAHYKEEPEKGKRCVLCIGDRLSQTARQAATMKIGRFGTVLTVSPHKNAQMINSLGKTAASVVSDEEASLIFMDADFKKKEGFKISSVLSRDLGFKRQDYCGCLHSRRSRRNRAAIIK